MHARIKSIQIGERRRADRRAAQREAVELFTCLTVIQTYGNPNWIKQRILGTA